MLMVRIGYLIAYLGLMAILIYPLVWVCWVCMAAVDLTLIGHIKGWKPIKYPKWIGGAINKNRRYGYEIVNDQITHPQVLWLFAAALLVLGGPIGLDIGIWQFVNDVSPWVLVAIAAALYIPSYVCRKVLKSYAKHLYLAYVFSFTDAK